MQSFWPSALVILAVFGGTLGLTAAVRGWLLRRAILDRPGHRSSHAAPVPRGGGIAVVPVLVAGWLALAALGAAPEGTIPATLAASCLALLSWRDDLGGLPIGLRLAMHAMAVAVGLAFLPPAMLVFQGWLPLPLDRVAAGLLWLWFVNLYNFMDGIDGITGIETACLGVGAALVLALAGTAGEGAALALAAAAAGLGFLRWNWHPATIFLGDSGSVPLGYLTGWLLLGLAGRGLWAPALILPLYYLADATITLAARMRRGERFWEAHRGHFYQRALAPDGDHAAVAGMILGGNLVLLASAALALAAPAVALVLALATTGLLLVLLQRRAARAATR